MNKLFPIPQAVVDRLLWSANGHYLAVLLKHGGFLIYDGITHMCIPWTKRVRERIWCLAWSPDNDHLVVVDHNTIQVIAASTGIVTHTLAIPPGYGHRPLSVAWSHSGIVAVTTSVGKCILYNIQSGQQIEWEPENTQDCAVEIVHGWITSAKDIKPLFSIGTELRIGNLRQRKIQTILTEEFEVTRGSCALNKNRVACVDTPNLQVCLYSYRTMLKKERIYQPETTWISPYRGRDEYGSSHSHIAWSPKGLIATCFGTQQRRIYIWDATTGVTRQVIDLPERLASNITTLAWGKDNLLSLGTEQYFCLYQV